MKRSGQPEIERRYIHGPVGIQRRDNTGEPVMIGHAAVFDKRSENLGGFTEFIAPDAFSDADMSDVRGLFNHNNDLVLGRTTNGTVRVKVDSEGLAYEIDPPDTTVARDLVVLMERGDVNQSSFAFSVARGGATWDEDDETGALVRTITKMERIYDVSPVTFPAYPDAEVGLRELAAFRSALEGREETGKLHRESLQRMERIMERRLELHRVLTA